MSDHPQAADPTMAASCALVQRAKLIAFALLGSAHYRGRDRLAQRVNLLHELRNLVAPLDRAGVASVVQSMSHILSPDEAARLVEAEVEKAHQTTERIFGGLS